MLHPDDPLSPDQGYKPQGWFGNMFGETQSRFANPDGVDESSKQDIIDSEEQWYDGWRKIWKNISGNYLSRREEDFGIYYIDPKN